MKAEGLLGEEEPEGWKAGGGEGNLEEQRIYANA